METFKFERIGEAVLVAAITGLIGMAVVDHDARIRNESRIEQLRSDHDRAIADIILRLEHIERFTEQGARFTAQDGRDLQKRVGELEKRLHRSEF